MSLGRRVVAMLLCMVAVSCMLTSAIQAQTTGGYIAVEAQINPLYAQDAFAQEALQKQMQMQMAPMIDADPGAVVHTDYDEMVQDLIDQLKRRVVQPAVRFQDNGRLLEMTNQQMQEYFLGIFHDAVGKHTGDPKEGDYLRWQWNTVRGGISYQRLGNVYTYTFTYTPGYFTTAAQEALVDAAVEELLAELNVDEASDYAKTRAVYDWITANVDYVNDGDVFCHSAYAALIDKQAVCQGYATLLYRLLLELDVDNRIITSQTHGWNIVQQGVLYYNCDATWDEGRANYRYFLGGKDAFANVSDHIPEADYTTEEFRAEYPMAWDAYTPGQENITLTPTGLSLTLADEVAYNIYCDMTGVPAGAKIIEYGMCVYDEDPAYAEDKEPAYESKNAAMADEDTFTTQSESCPAKELGNIQYFQPYMQLSDGAVFTGRVVTGSAASYVQNILHSDCGDEMKALAVALLNYGAAAQELFDYRTDALVNRSLTKAQQALCGAYSDAMLREMPALSAAKTVEFTETEGAFFDSKVSVTLDGALGINYYAKPAYAPDANGVKLCMWTKKTAESADMLTLTNADQVLQMTDSDSDGTYHACIDGLAAKMIDDVYYVTFVYTSGGKTNCFGVVPSSINSYCATLRNTGDTQQDKKLAEAMVVYGYCADAYFD